MPITFNVTAMKNPQKPNAPVKYYARVIGNGKITLDDLAKRAAASSTVSKADILAVLESTFSTIAEEVAAGNIVYVGEYFTLRATGSSEARESSEEVDSRAIKKLSVAFRPGKMIQDALKTATFKRK
ncbi:HU family DNA-binding protein [Chryseobacterium sp.]|uniref:HU family DNA-binding protein n=1 Tax=Chryseobacterium sp. TaxID=1871047 RepID=UPI0011C6ECBD|nr:HU family DNA-binding protein [Chryseobacterium sp.]TXF77391.1 DNA-binding protein [Chryseobacterium sp.]